MNFRVRGCDDRPQLSSLPHSLSMATGWKNGGILNATLAKLQPGDTLVVPNKTFYVMGGIIVYNLTE